MSNNQEKLMIVRLGLHQWYPRKFDKKATADLAALHGVDVERAGRFNKILVDLESIKPLQQRLRKLREDHYAMTAPWADGGDRVLPADLYFTYVEMVREADQEIAVLADDYAVQYSAEVDRARVELNGLFSEADYPAPHKLRQRFGIDWKFEPLPNADDVRVWGIGEAAAEEIRAEVEAGQQAAVNAAQSHVVEQVVERANEFVSKVRKYDAQVSQDKKGVRLYDSAIDNLAEIVELVLDGLNITGDQELAKLAKQLSKEISGTSADKLRHSGSQRDEKTKKVEKIMSKFSGVYG
jgi:hypothetical protein